MIKHFYSENVYDENASYYESQSIIFYAYLVSVPPKRLNIRYIFYILEMLDCSTQTRQGAARRTWWDVSTGECLLSGADSNTQRRLNAKIQILQYSVNLTQQKCRDSMTQRLPDYPQYTCTSVLLGHWSL